MHVALLCAASAVLRDSTRGPWDAANGGARRRGADGDAVCCARAACAVAGRRTTCSWRRRRWQSSSWRRFRPGRPPPRPTTNGACAERWERWISVERAGRAQVPQRRCARRPAVRRHAEFAPAICDWGWQGRAESTHGATPRSAPLGVCVARRRRALYKQLVDFHGEVLLLVHWSVLAYTATVKVRRCGAVVWRLLGRRAAVAFVRERWRLVVWVGEGKKGEGREQCR